MDLSGVGFAMGDVIFNRKKSISCLVSGDVIYCSHHDSNNNNNKIIVVASSDIGDFWNWQKKILTVIKTRKEQNTLIDRKIFFVIINTLEIGDVHCLPNARFDVV